MPEESSNTLQANSINVGGDTVARDKITTNITNVYQNVRPQPVDEATLTAALARLEALPLDLPPSPAPLPTGSRLPYARNPMFVGREDDLQQLARTLKAGDTAAIGQIAAATGLGGIGKTQLAVEFAHRYGPYFVGGVFWIGMANAESVPVEIAQCGGVGALDLRPDFANLKLDDQVALVLSAWQNALPRLLIFDNCEDPALLAQWRPPSGGSCVLVTSRRAEWEPALNIRTLSLDTLTRSESLTLLRQFRPGAAESDLDAIAAELGDLPLALHLAGSYLARYKQAITPQSFLAELRGPKLLEHPALTGKGAEYSPTAHEHNVARTFALSYDRLNPDDAMDALARRALARAACLAPGELIPRSLLALTLELGDDKESTLQVEDALLRLTDMGLLEAEDDGALRLHRLLARFVQLAGVEGEDIDTVEEALLGEANRINQSGYPAPLLAWQLHLAHVAEQADKRKSEPAGTLFNELGYHLWMISDYVRARTVYERALQIDEAVFGSDDPNVARDVNNLGLVLEDLGDYASAGTAYLRALRIYENALGPEHPNVAIAVNNIGCVLQVLGDYKGARAAYTRALQLDEAAFGLEHPNVARDFNSLGNVLGILGDHAGARAALERALHIWEHSRGSEHPSVATATNNLGFVLQALEDYAGARAAFERALRIDEAAFGHHHPNVARDVHNLGDALRALGDYAGARAAYERALYIFERVFGSEHPKTQTVRGNLETLE